MPCITMLVLQGLSQVMESQVCLPLLNFALSYKHILKILNYGARLGNTVVLVSMVTCSALPDFTCKSVSHLRAYD